MALTESVPRLRPKPLNRRSIHRLGICLLAVASSAANVKPAAAEFVVNDVVISDPSTSLIDPEYDLNNDRVVWQDLDGNLWLADMDPDTGAIIPTNGQGQLIDVDLTSIQITLNGPEWAHGADGSSIVYTKRLGLHQNALGAARQDEFGNWVSEVLASSQNRLTPLGTSRENHHDSRIAYFAFTQQRQRVIAWRDTFNSATERVVVDDSLTSPRWVEGGEQGFVTTVNRNNIKQVAYYDVDTRTLTDLTNDPGDKFLPFMWWAPEYGELLLMTMVDTTNVGIYRNINGTWSSIYNFTLPTSKPFVHSPEPFVHNGKSYILLVAADQLGSGNFFGQPVGPTEIWIAGIDAGAPFFRRVDDPTTEENRLDPEIYFTSGGPVVLYTEKNLQTLTFLLRRADTGLGPSTGYDVPSYGVSWSAIHRDNRNSSHAPVTIADRYAESFWTTLPSVQREGLTIGPEGNLYFTFRELGPSGTTLDPALVASDSSSGLELFRLDEQDTTSNLDASANLIDADGDFYLPGNSAMNKFSSTGVKLWSTPIRGITKSAQFAPDGKLIFFTWNGWVYILDPADGAILLERNLVPWRTFGASPNCLLTGGDIGCAFTSVPAVDPVRGFIYTRYIRQDGRAVLHAYRYQKDPYDLKKQWSSVIFAGGSTSSPALSRDYSRLYLHDGGNNLVAIDTQTGTVLWTFDVGYAAKGSPVVGENGYIMPGISHTDPLNDSLGIVKDLGSTAGWVFSTSQYLPASAAAAGSGDRFVIFGRDTLQADRVNMLVLHPQQGIIGASPWLGGEDPERITGVALREDGWIFANTWGTTGYKAFVPQ